VFRSASACATCRTGDIPAVHGIAGGLGILRRAQRRLLMFVDATAIAAILTREAEADALADRLDRAAGCITSPIAVVEAALTIAASTRRAWQKRLATFGSSSTLPGSA
jgi:hypothetical protein